ncbi:PVC-type heme-binding CxxCH protein [Aquisphaera insulae]|uniref:PVC-type heme-binding CxxCH protein n=1 Tax=Aquisphaera insulae TaxID=2712864 RepID=UPI0013EA18FF|nr:PVC-type heme-binding CxxCH protein [Aquisphaera insulae]
MSNRFERRFLVLCLGLVLVPPSPAEEPRPKPLPPAEAARRLVAADGLRIEPVLAEPTIAQPVFLNFDERGRLWLVEYRQYPNPAGLVELSRDKFWRAVYDKVPAPPPLGDRGLDRITIHEDADGDGTYERHKTFVDGLNIATSCVRGRGGVWVLNPPYLLFYPDHDGDDVPDGDPVVHLRGFGLEDTHSVVNSLRWGPDGWLYAAQGSTVSGDVIRPGLDKTPVHSLGQLIWRYHPESKRYEIFAEGGGNAFGVEIDAKGRIFSGHNGGDTRGFHYVQGGYSLKGFQKHGPLSNPYAFGYFPAMKHEKVERFTHNFLINEGDALRPEDRGKLFGVEPLQGRVVEAEILPDGSTFRTHDIGYAVRSDDPWFRPVDIKAGPDGSIYVCDFYEGQIAHLRHHEGTIDPSNGRVYRLSAAGFARRAVPDLGKKSSDELVSVLLTGNRWARATALRLLADRRDRTAIPRLSEAFHSGSGQAALEALWGLNACGGLDEAESRRGLEHADPYVRIWSIRLLGDSGRVSPTVASSLAALAVREPNVEVRSQLACTSRRLPADQGLPIVARLLARDEDAADVHVPLLLWWAIEARCGTDRDAVLTLLRDRDLWGRPIVQQQILARLMQRFAAAGSQKDLRTCAQLLDAAPDLRSRSLLMQGFEIATKGRSLATMPEELAAALARSGGGSLLLDLRRGRPGAVDEALKIAADPSADPRRRIAVVEALGETRQARVVPALRELAVKDGGELRLTALNALLPFDDPSIAPAILGCYPSMPDDARAAAETLLAARKGSALALLQAIDAGRIERAGIMPETVRTLSVHHDPRIVALLARLWPDARGAATEQLRREVERLDSLVRTGAADRARGKVVFMGLCGKCHVLFGEGAQVGPDLTSYMRNDLPNLLRNIVDPDAEIREGFQSVQVATKDGRVLAGILTEQDPQSLVLRGADGRDIALRRDDVEEIQGSKHSLMPEGILKPLDDAQVRDLLSYLRSSQPLN